MLLSECIVYIKIVFMVNIFLIELGDLLIYYIDMMIVLYVYRLIYVN